MIAQDLLEILRCPHCVSHQTRQPGDDPGQLIYHQDTWLICKQCDRKYPICDDIPVMLIERGDVYRNTKIEDLQVPPPADACA
jgi:hypothetical protein